MENKTTKSNKVRKVRFDDIVTFFDCLRNGELEQVKEYISSKTFLPNVTLESGISCLHLAVESGNVKLVEYLVETGVNINHQDEDGWTPLHLASLLEDIDVIESLLKNGAQNDILSYEGELPCEVTESEEVEAFLQNYGHF